MVTRSFRCDPNRLRLLLNDQLPEESHAELAQHVETCPSCRRRLESLPGHLAEAIAANEGELVEVG